MVPVMLRSQQAQNTSNEKSNADRYLFQASELKTLTVMHPYPNLLDRFWPLHAKLVKHASKVAF